MIINNDTPQVDGCVGGFEDGFELLDWIIELVEGLFESKETAPAEERPSDDNLAANLRLKYLAEYENSKKERTL